jgi:hypothetical protein
LSLDIRVVQRKVRERWRLPIDIPLGASFGRSVMSIRLNEPFLKLPQMLMMFGIAFFSFQWTFPDQ